MSEYNILFKGHMNLVANKLELCISDVSDDVFICNFDELSSKCFQLNTAIAISLKKLGITASFQEDGDLVDQAQLNSKAINSDLYDCFDSSSEQECMKILMTLVVFMIV
jgi:hypothetical protein